MYLKHQHFLQYTFILSNSIILGTLVMWYYFKLRTAQVKSFVSETRQHIEIYLYYVTGLIFQRTPKPYSEFVDKTVESLTVR